MFPDAALFTVIAVHSTVVHSHYIEDRWIKIGWVRSSIRNALVNVVMTNYQTRDGLVAAAINKVTVICRKYVVLTGQDIAGTTNISPTSGSCPLLGHVTWDFMSGLVRSDYTALQVALQCHADCSFPWRFAGFSTLSLSYCVSTHNPWVRIRFGRPPTYYDYKLLRYCALFSLPSRPSSRLLTYSVS